MRALTFLERWVGRRIFERGTPSPAIKPKKPRGKRRPNGGDNVRLAVTLPARLVEKIRYDASAADESMSEAIEGLLREGYPDAKPLNQNIKGETSDEETLF